MKRGLLDLYSGAGGAARGYQMAGFHVTGVDIRSQPRYIGDDFHEGDALEFVEQWGRDFDVIHASPPCQAFTALRSMPNAKAHENLIPQTRTLLEALGKPFTIENVPGAPLRPLVMLCGTMFGLGTASGAELRRHRYFEINWSPGLLPPCAHYTLPKVIGVYGGHGRDRRRTVTVCGSSGRRSIRDGTQGFTVAERSEAMGIDWMTGAELSQAIPPAYTFWLGRELWLML